MSSIALSAYDLRRAVYKAMDGLPGEETDVIWWHTKNQIRYAPGVDEGAMPTSDMVYAALQELCAEGKVRKYATGRQLCPIAYVRKHRAELK